MQRKIILFELNEVPMEIVRRFATRRPASTLATILPGCHRFVTVAEDQAPLTPWTTWPSLHRGIGDAEHEILEFGQDLHEVDRTYPPLWRILADHGVSTGVCGSLHSAPLPDDLEGFAFYLPDTFAAGSECFPSDLAPFQDFNLQAARASSRSVARGLPWTSALRMLSAAPGLGLRLSTLADAGRQLASERLARWRRIRRRTTQARLAFDVFQHQLQSTRPDFCTFFTNHVASSMHRYWAAAFPEHYETHGFDDAWIRRFRHEIDFTMARFDGMLARLVRFVGDHPEYQIWIATSMGQEATQARPVRRHVHCRQPTKLLETLGVEPGRVELRPAMAPQVNARLQGDVLDGFVETLEELRIGGARVPFRVVPGGLVSVSFGQENLGPEQEFAILRGRHIAFSELGLVNLQLEDEAGTNAFHIPRGTLLIHDPRNGGVKPEGPEISTLDLAPSILRNFAVPVPSYMSPAASLS